MFGGGLLTAGGGQGQDDRYVDRAGCRWCRRCQDDPGGAGGSGRVSRQRLARWELHERPRPARRQWRWGWRYRRWWWSDPVGPAVSAGSAGGIRNTATRDGHPPSSIVATGAGGGAGGWSGGDANNGAFPGGAGGGGRGAATGTASGAGAAATMFIIEHLARHMGPGRTRLRSPPTLYYPPTGLRSLQVILRGGGGAGKGGGVVVRLSRPARSSWHRPGPTGGVYDPVEVVVGCRWCRGRPVHLVARIVVPGIWWRPWRRVAPPMAWSPPLGVLGDAWCRRIPQALPNGGDVLRAGAVVRRRWRRRIPGSVPASVAAAPQG